MGLFGKVPCGGGRIDPNAISPLIARQENRVVTPPTKVGPINWRPFIAAFHRLAPKLWRAYANVIDGTLRLRLANAETTREQRIGFTSDCIYTQRIRGEIDDWTWNMLRQQTLTTELAEECVQFCINTMLLDYRDQERNGIQRMKKQKEAETPKYLAADPQLEKTLKYMGDLYAEIAGVEREKPQPWNAEAKYLYWQLVAAGGFCGTITQTCRTERGWDYDVAVGKVGKNFREEELRPANEDDVLPTLPWSKGETGFHVGARISWGMDPRVAGELTLITANGVIAKDDEGRYFGLPFGHFSQEGPAVPQFHLSDAVSILESDGTLTNGFIVELPNGVGRSAREFLVRFKDGNTTGVVGVEADKLRPRKLTVEQTAKECDEILVLTRQKREAKSPQFKVGDRVRGKPFHSQFCDVVEGVIESASPAANPEKSGYWGYKVLVDWTDREVPMKLPSSFWVLEKELSAI